jgi:hypothetical protein
LRPLKRSRSVSLRDRDLDSVREITCSVARGQAARTRATLPACRN